MAWQRRGSKLYFYRSFKVAGRVRTLYFGAAGGAGELAAALDMLRRVEAIEEAEREEAARGLRRAADDALARLRDAADLLVRASMIVAGCHNHKGAWRRRRGQAA
jgi:hypothetical protein